MTFCEAEIGKVMRVAALVICVWLLGACTSIGDRPPEWLSGFDPIYPAQAKASGVQGYVVVQYGVSEAGDVLDPQVVESQPPGVFDASALAAVQSWRYRPAVRDREDVAVSAMSSRLDYKLDAGAYSGY